VPDVIEEHKDEVISHWLQRVKSNDELVSLPLTESDRKDHVPGLLDEAIARAFNRLIGIDREQAAEQHGTLRYHQGYTVAMLIVEAGLLQNVISECVRRNFLVIDLSNSQAPVSPSPFQRIQFIQRSL
jgi:hypothetical protein